MCQTLASEQTNDVALAYGLYMKKNYIFFLNQEVIKIFLICKNK